MQTLLTIWQQLIQMNYLEQDHLNKIKMTMNGVKTNNNIWQTMHKLLKMKQESERWFDSSMIHSQFNDNNKGCKWIT